MALVNCPECGREVSTTATACPHCGAKGQAAPVAKSGGGKGCLWLLIGAVVLFVLYSLGSSRSFDVTPRTVTYYVEGSAGEASLTYENAQGGTEQTKVTLPWKQTMQVRAGSFLYMSAQNQGQYGTVTVRITVDGKEFKRSDASGEYSIASASGSCP